MSKKIYNFDYHSLGHYCDSDHNISSPCEYKHRVYHLNRSELIDLDERSLANQGLVRYDYSDKFYQLRWSIHDDSKRAYAY